MQHFRTKGINSTTKENSGTCNCDLSSSSFWMSDCTCFNYTTNKTERVGITYLITEAKHPYCNPAYTTTISHKTTYSYLLFKINFFIICWNIIFLSWVFSTIRYPMAFRIITFSIYMLLPPISSLTETTMQAVRIVCQWIIETCKLKIKESWGGG